MPRVGCGTFTDTIQTTFALSCTLTQANPKFSDEVDRVLRRSNSEIIRHSLSKEIPEVRIGFAPTQWTGW